jgi:hypothetical protein
MHNVKDGSVEGGCCKRVEWILLGFVVCGIDVGTDSSVSDSTSKVLVDISTLYISWHHTRKVEGPTFVAMNLSTRYWVKTLITTSASVCESLSIKGRRRA